MSETRVYMVVRESFVQSVMSDIATFGMLSFCVWFSSGSKFWCFVCFLMFLVFISAGALKRVKGATSFRSKQQLQEWLDKEKESE